MPKKTEIFTAVTEGNIDKIKSLITTHGFNINTRDEEGLTPLHLAAEKGDIECVEVLLKLNANPNSVTLKASTPLHFAAETGNVKCIQALLDAGADANSKDIISKTPAHYIAQSGNLDAIEKLSEWKMNIHAKDNYGRPPINYARNYGHLQAVEALISMGAENFITIGQLFTAFGGEKLYSVLPPNLQNLHNNLQNDYIETFGTFLYYLTSFFEERECIENDAKEKQILNIYRDIYKNEKKSLQELSKDLEKNGMIVFGLNYSGHYGTASLKKENEMITFSIYDRGKLIKFDFSRDEKGQCVRSITGKLNAQQIQDLISSVRNISSQTTEVINDTIYKDKIPALFGDVPFEYKDYLLQKPASLGVCFYQSNKVPIADLFITFFGLQKGLSLYKEFTFYYRKKISIDFQLSNMTLDKELKARLKKRCDDILARKIDLSNYKQASLFNTKNVNSSLKKMKFSISDLCEVLPVLGKQLQNAQGNSVVYNLLIAFYEKIKNMLDDQIKLMECLNGKAYLNVLTEDEIINKISKNIEFLNNFYINLKRYGLYCANILDTKGNQGYINANETLFKKTEHTIFSNLNQLQAHVKSMLEDFSNNNHHATKATNINKT